jgi:hypothetical protein
MLEILAVNVSHRFSDRMRHLLRRPGPFSVSVLR